MTTRRSICHLNPCLQGAPIGGSEAVVRVGLVRCRRGGRRLRLKAARPGRCHGPAMPGGW